MKYSRFFVLVLALFPIFATATELPIDEATYYSDAFEGAGTSNGDRFEQAGASAAQCAAPLGNYVYVSRGGTGVVVDANDRPNCSRHANVVDLSSSIFRLFAPLSAGRLTDISVTDMGPALTDTVKKSLPRDVFAHLGVTLTSDVPNILIAGQGIVISGTADGAAGYVIVSVSSEDDSYKDSHLETVSPSGRFQAKIRLPDTPGKYAFVIAAGKGFNTNKYATLTLIEKTLLVYPALPEKTISISTRITQSDDTSAPTLVLPPSSYAALDIRQGKKSVTLEGNAIVFDKPLSLVPGKASIVIRGNTQSTTSPLDKSSASTLWYSGSVFLDRTHEVIGRDNLHIRTIRNNANVLFNAPDDIRIRAKYYLTLPSGDVREVSFPGVYIDTDGFLRRGSTVSLRVPLSTEGTTILEIVRQDGLAHANVPLQRGNVWSILEPLTDTEIRTLSKDISRVVRVNLERINLVRSIQKKQSVTLDTNLTALAQAKVNDMISRNYEGHADPDGKYVDTLARKIGIEIDGSIGENIGFGTVSHLALQDGLEESGVHKYNMLSPNWTRVGIGYGVNQGKTYLVQIFGD